MRFLIVFLGGSVVLRETVQYPRMSEDIDKHVLRKYEIVSKLGKGVFLCFGVCTEIRFDVLFSFAGVWNSLEGYRQKDAGSRCSEESLRCVSKRN